MFVDVSVPRNDPELPVFFNVDAHVGAGCPNRQDDVLLVQFMIRVVASRPDTGPKSKAALSNVRTTGRCDQATVDAIVYCQQLLKKDMPATVVDGRVSPIRNGKVNYGGGFYTLAYLNYRTSEASAPWPRLQEMPNCPGPLADAASRALGCKISTRVL